MEDFGLAFEERLVEMDAYLNLLQALEDQVRDGVPHLGDAGPQITVVQQRILYSSAYLQLYNLVESTITLCVDSLIAAVAQMGVPAKSLSDAILREWTRAIARTHQDLNYENRLDSALELCRRLVLSSPVEPFEVTRGGGNLDDRAIEKLAKRLGLDLKISEDNKQTIKRKEFRDGTGALTCIKNLRNALAHGSLSFVECGEGVTVCDLKKLKDRIELYLKDVISCFKAFISSRGYLSPEFRDGGASA